MPKWYLAESSLDTHHINTKKNHRGINVYTLTELRGITGQTQRGDLVTTTFQMPLFSLTPEERQGIMQASAPVQAVISSRMNRISSAEWDIIRKKDIEDEIYTRMKDLKQVFDEFKGSTNLVHMITMFKIRQTLQSELKELRDDLSNFDPSMVRYRKRINRRDDSKKEEIREWINQPNLEDDFMDWVKKWVNALMLDGASSIYREFTRTRLENFYNLPGGTVYPLRSVHVGSYVGYAQIIVGHIPKIYFENELIFTNYLPSAARSYGYVPLDALINKVSEQILFDQFAAQRADGTKEPEKLVVFGDQKTPFSDLTGDITLPININEQKRREEKLNEIRKGAIATLSGVGHPVVLDISKADTFAAQDQRQDRLLRDIALVFNMTNMEINLAGGQFTSGRETSETQQEIEEGKGIRPIIQKLQSILTRKVIYSRFGTDYEFQYKKSLTELEQVEIDTKKMLSGTYTKNEIRSNRGDDPVFEQGNDSLQTQQAQPGGSPFVPLNMRNV